MSFPVEVKPCPLCGGHDLSIKYHMTYGQGDSGYNGLRIFCQTCECSIGDGYYYGEPSKAAIVEVCEKWNKAQRC